MDLGVARRLEAMAAWSHEWQLPAAALMIFIAAIFFANDALPRSLYVATVLPLCGLALFGPARRSLAPSTVLFACVVYLLAMDVATLVGGDATGRQMGQQIEATVLIAVFLLITGSMVGAWPRFTDRFFSYVAAAVALSIAINAFIFFRDLDYRYAYTVIAYRLTTTIGMPGYSNSTNISATYAVFFVGALATCTDVGALRRHRLIAALAALVVGAGVVLTQSRSALVAVAIGILVLAMTRSRRLQYAVAAGAALLLVAIMVSPDIRLALFLRGFSDRPELWASFLDLILERPWSGYGSFSPVGVVAGGVFVDQAHNLVLSGWLRGGVVAAASMAFILAGGIYWSLSYWRATGNSTVLAVIVTIAVAGMFDYQLMITYPTWPWVTFWLPFGLAVGAEMAVRRMRAAGVPATEVRSGLATRTS